MFGILVSAFNLILGFVLRSVVVKFATFFALYFITTEFISIVAGLLPTSASLSSSMGGIPADVWFFLDLFNFTNGFPLLVSAFATRFIIRRMPVIG